jgi:hypothetical protein
MSVNEVQALTQKFADAFDQRDLQPVMEILSEDVEVFDHVPYRFDGKPIFARLGPRACGCFLVAAQPESSANLPLPDYGRVAVIL